MPDPSDGWWEEMRQGAAQPPPAGEASPRARAPVILGAVAALALSGGLAWWLASPERPAFRNSPVVQVQPRSAAPVRVAALSADPEQVRRAYADFTTVYSTSGAGGVARFSESCADSLKADPRILDFCLAFDLFADSVAEPAGQDASSRIALVQAALPSGAQPDARIAEVRRLMRQVTGVPESPPAAPKLQQAIAPPPARPPRANLQKASAPVPLRTPASPIRTARADPCRGKPTADRLVCAYPALAAQHRRMRAAYDHALAAGADPLAIDRAQAEWREARAATGDRARLYALYERRIRELTAAARKPPPEEPPS
jgi:hypothetical protein